MVDAQYIKSVEEGSVPRIASLISTAFAGPVKDCEEWVRSQNLTDLRGVARASDGRVDACLRRLDMGQYFGGRSVKMAGIAGVAVAPEARGGGLARWMMRRTLEELYADGVPLSTLYASTQTLYRQVGYEQGGHRVRYTLPLSEIDTRDRSGGSGWEALDVAGVERLAGCYRAYASRFDGPLDRGAYVWKRTFDWRDRKAVAYASVGAGGEVDAYATVAQKQKETGRIALELTDCAFRDGAGAHRLLGMLHDYASMADDVTFFAGPHHPLLWLLGQQRASATFREYWMLRLVRVADALRDRGYNHAINAEVHLHVLDGALPQNTGPLVLRVSGGRAEVTPGGRGDVRISERALASVYTGLVPARELAASGDVSGPEGALVALEAVFAPRGAPWMPDFF